jgi:PAS domain S-box-containing protein
VRSALDNLVSGLVVLDMHELIVLANQAFAQHAGKSPEQLMGRRIWKLPWAVVGDEALPEYPWRAAMANNTVQSKAMMQFRCHDGMTRTFMANCAPVLGHNGVMRGVLVSLDDVTELERKEVELRESRDAADKANSAKSEFLARMSHEIRTPLNAILGFADVLRRGFVSSDDERQEYLDTIHASGQHLLAVINDILDLSKVESGRLEIERVRCAPHDLIRQVMAELSVRARERGISLEYSATEGLPQTIITDPVRFRQLLLNLVGNAVKFTERGGVRVTARLVRTRDGRRLSVEIADTGMGMSADTLVRLFQPFMQADTSITRRYGGTGLGLSIAKRLAEALGGGITVTSALGKGSVFTVTIDPGEPDGAPMVDAVAGAESPAAAAPADSVAPLKLPPCRVLVADDGASNRKLVQVVLTRAGMSIQATDNGLDAVKLGASGNFDLILMDMHMPVMDGLTATHRLRAQGCRIPIIAMTADVMKDDEAKCLAAGCTGFLPKPIQIDRLVQTIAAQLAPTSPPSGRGETEPKAPLPAAATPQPAQRARQANRIASRLPTDDPDFCEIVDEFVDRLGQQLGAMQQAWAENDLKQLAALAHWLKGSGGTAGFDAFTGPAAELEQLAKQSQLDRVGKALSELLELAARVERPRPVVQQPHQAAPTAARGAKEAS